MSDSRLPPGYEGVPGPVVGCFLCGTFPPLPQRWKQGRLQLDADGVRWGPGSRGRDVGSLLPAPLTIRTVRDVRGWERLHIRSDAFQVVEVETEKGEVRVALPRERVPIVVDHIRENGERA